MDDGPTLLEWTLLVLVLLCYCSMMDWVWLVICIYDNRKGKVLWKGMKQDEARKAIKELQNRGYELTVYDSIKPKLSPFKRIW